MGQFDMHGGNFAPLGYLKVNAGGSHEENPNGGVQIGVDPQGIPNMVEEGESIYKDFVYSDNIRAERKFLEENHLPVKFAGKLYSEIVDKFVDEAEDRPNDPISNNGLNEMLLRLAQAQEAQKAEQERRELENELSQLSPEELEQLEAMLAQPEQAPVEEIAPEQMMVPAGPAEETVPQQAVPEQIPMMACGGKMRKMDDGGPIKTYDDLASEILAETRNNGRASGIGNTDLPLVDEHPEMDVALAVTQPGSVVTKLMAPSVYRGMVNGLANGEGAMALMPFIGGVGKYMKEADAIKSNTAKYAGKTWDKAREILIDQKTLDDIVKDAETKLGNLKAEAKNASDASMFRGRIASAEADLKTAKFNAKQNVKKFDETVHRAYQSEAPVKTEPEQKVKSESGKKAGDVVKTVFDPGRLVVSKWNPQSKAGKVMKGITHGAGTVAAYNYGYFPALGAAWNNGFVPAHNYIMREYFPEKVEKKYVEGNDMDSLFDESVQTGDALDSLFAYGGRMNRYDGGGWAKFLEDLNNYSISRDRSNAQGMYRIDRGFPLYGYKDIYALEQSDPYKAFTQYVLNNPNDENVQKYLRALDLGTADWTEKLFDGDTLKSNWKALYEARRNDQKGGIYHFSGAWDNLDDLGALTRQKVSAVGAPAVGPYQVTGPKGTLLGMPSVPSQEKIYEVFPGQAMMLARMMGMRNAGNNAGPQDKDEDENNRYNGYVPLPTAGRYAKALGAAALGLYDLAQEPYKYQFPEIRPQAPWGTVNYQPLVYNPMDWALPYNVLSSQTNAALRSLRGTGPSQGANVIALDNNATQNLGNAMGQVWQQNNAHRNEIVAGNNQTEGQRAAFDYGVAKDRAMLYDQAARMNFQKELYRQKWNQDEEAAKYQALGNQIDAVNEALAGIATENFRMNQANTNTGLQGYQLVPNGVGGYKLVSTGECGGTLLKKHKK